MRRLRNRCNDIKTAAMLQRWHLATGCSHFGWVDVSHDNAWLDAAFSENTAPWIDNERVAERLTTVLVLAALCRRKDEGAILDGAGADQRIPVRFARLARESG